MIQSVFVLSLIKSVLNDLAFLPADNIINSLIIINLLFRLYVLAYGMLWTITQEEFKWLIITI